MMMSEEIEITPAMIEAGIEALCLFIPSEDELSHIVSEVYTAMRDLEAASAKIITFTA